MEDISSSKYHYFVCKIKIEMIFPVVFIYWNSLQCLPYPGCIPFISDVFYKNIVKFIHHNQQNSLILCLTQPLSKYYA